MENQFDPSADANRLKKDAALEASKFGNEVGNHFDHAKDAARPIFDRLSDGAQRAADGVSDAASKASSLIGERGRQIMDSETKMVNGVAGYIRTNPISSFAMMVSAGLVLSMLFKRR